MVRVWILVLVVGIGLVAACRSEASVIQSASHAFAPVGDLVLLANRDLSPKQAFANPTNRVPDSKLLYDIRSLLIEAGMTRVVPVVEDQIVYLKGVATSASEAKEIEATIQDVFGVRAVVNELRVP